MNGNLYDRMFAALEQMDEGKEPVAYLVGRFWSPSDEYRQRVMQMALRVVGDFYANYF